MQKLRCKQACEANKYLGSKKTYWRKNDFHFERLYKTACCKIKFSSFSILIDCYMSVLFSFLIKALEKSEKLIRFHHQAFVICKNVENLKILKEIFRWKLVVCNGFFLFFFFVLDHLKPKIFFAGQSWLPIKSALLL